MLFDSVNLQDELDKEKRAKTEASLMDTVNTILAESADKDQQLVDRLYQKNSGASPKLEKKVPNSDRVYTEEMIQSVCTNFRLRFLEIPLFKGEIPYEALQQVKNFEAEYGFEAETFKIMAPASRFRLKDATSDPLLFAALGNGQYYLLHQWGDDLAWYRKLAYFPYRSIFTLAMTATLLGLIVALMVPGEAFLSESLGAISTARVVYFKFFATFIMSGMFFVTGLIIGILTIRDFSSNVWNSKFFN
ncbi:MAG: hypothetical protein ACFB10_07490 [Salibacteraceae bacterium]